MNQPEPHIRAHGEDALKELDRLKSGGGTEIKERIAHVIDQLVLMRNELIAAQRGGKPVDEWLARTNAILSSIFGTEFPKGGLQWKRICESRDALRNLLGNA